MRLGLNGFGVGVVVFIAAYVASIVLYVNSGVAHPHQVAESPPSSGGTTVTVDTQDIQWTCIGGSVDPQSQAVPSVFMPFACRPGPIRRGSNGA
jgi:hypothetical protein